MSEIQFKGAKYIEVQGGPPVPPPRHKHDKCKAGTHWNDKSQSCRKLPPGLKAMRNKAHSLSAVADRHVEKADRMEDYGEGSHMDRADAHGDARSSSHRAMKAHQAVSNKAKGLGYSKLYRKHKAMARGHEHDKKYHSELEDKHLDDDWKSPGEE